MATNERMTYVALMDPSKGWGDDDAMQCPFCGDVHVNFDGPYLVNNGDYKSWKGGRGPAAVLRMHCESGHSWNLIFGSHKGYTLLSIQKLNKKEGGPQ